MYSPAKETGKLGLPDGWVLPSEEVAWTVVSEGHWP